MPRARLLTAAVALAATVVATGLPSAAHAARADDSWPVDGNSTLTFEGRGYGHGYGMSQYGAEGAAREGRTWKQIVGFYYPGTKVAETKGQIKVLLSADTDGDVTVQAARGLSVRKVSTGTSWTLPTSTKASQWRLVAKETRTSVQFRRTKGWTTWRTVAGEAEFSSSAGKVTLVLPGRTVEYRGRLRSAVPTGGGTRQTVNVLSLQSYLRGVVPLEIPALWHTEAVSAQAVAARTYAARERFDNSRRSYHLCDTTMCQVYGGVAAEHSAATAAVRRTAGQGLWHDKKPAFTQFSASNGGQAAQGSQPYLAAQADPYDRWSGNPYRTWKVAFTDKAIEKAWPQIGDLRRVEVLRRDGDGAWGGRVLTARLVGGKGSVEVSGSTVRSTLGLRSNYFTLTVTPR
ncbi:MAG: SpoIID/LytB domain-containing protein [Nocardioides sp.]|uniref:SpoIID/LytB domain-containing protein n=1 Tax=Nocardioides sp. TaxID=35761 RepID=UPI003F0443BC